MLVKTDLRFHPVAAARDVSYDPAAPLTAVNVQDAIGQVAAIAILPSGSTPKVVTFAMSPYTPLSTETSLLVNTTGGPVVIQMPLSATRLGATGYLDLTVKDDVGNSAVNAISVLRAGAELIDGVTSYPIDTAYMATTFRAKAAGYDVV